MTKRSKRTKKPLHTLSLPDFKDPFVITPFSKLLEMAERNPFDLAKYCNEIEEQLAIAEQQLKKEPDS
jgi:hypothetical protein